MEVLYANSSARSLLPPDWFGHRCWQAFPVLDAGCASSCPAVRAVGQSDEIVYCEEDLHPGNGVVVKIGVAVIPLATVQADGEKAILYIRPKPGDSTAGAFKSVLLENARRVQALALTPT